MILYEIIQFKKKKVKNINKKIDTSNLDSANKEPLSEIATICIAFINTV
jgi:hypothetical protein